MSGQIFISVAILAILKFVFSANFHAFVCLLVADCSHLLKLD